MAAMADNSKRTGAAVEAHYQFLLWLLPTVEKFPRSHKFTLGDRIETIALNVLETLIEATYTRDRAERCVGPFCANGGARHGRPRTVIRGCPGHPRLCPRCGLR